ncbi:hypothetical protein VDGL01_01876 [Verticillium dahliae]
MCCQGQPRSALRPDSQLGLFTRRQSASAALHVGQVEFQKACQNKKLSPVARPGVEAKEGELLLMAFGRALSLKLSRPSTRQLPTRPSQRVLEHPAPKLSNAPLVLYRAGMIYSIERQTHEEMLCSVIAPKHAHAHETASRSYLGHPFIVRSAAGIVFAPYRS